ncbi:MAG: hypothetical protein DSM107014_15210 [Gomphosphaeria aponina SAG 52.96 = DSM 107014]|uniref:Uncharacterized protein n=1 Tax=Gomphosphaeria aponina SAG 52.96 = DSM 107014 TaxID=1521640 RepID=A0A941GSX1_9CHRO|nr:hypothetical protein [Gomphosphaeria aponina SAG 52.96 = DSM 107014]
MIINKLQKLKLNYLNWLLNQIFEPENETALPGVGGKMKQDQGSGNQATKDSPIYHANECGQLELPGF